MGLNIIRPILVISGTTSQKSPYREHFVYIFPTRMVYMI